VGQQVQFQMPSTMEQAVRLAVTVENVEKHKQLTEGTKKIFAARRDVKCFRCSKIGHYARDCRQEPPSMTSGRRSWGIRALGAGNYHPATFSPLEEVQKGQDQAEKAPGHRRGLGSHLRTLVGQASNASIVARLGTGMRLSKICSSCPAPKGSGFDIQIPSVEPAIDGTTVGRLHVGISGLDLLLEVEIEGISHQLLVDSGASLSVMKQGIDTLEIRTTQTAARGITGTKLKILGTLQIAFRVGKRMFTHEFLIALPDTEYSGVLGVDVLRQMVSCIDLRTNTLVLGRRRHRLSGQEFGRCAPTHRQCRTPQGVSRTGSASPEMTPSGGPTEVPLPGLS
jgi:hypothetical protein